ncbi:dTDP-glucose 4,6-dehydratase [Anaerocolumna sp. MB42-C2]|uniref:dTDP-glucose 4,6-dehydratase n=1 Tax=Anaerocolumna sp. MB42-C2 TaxID=3070997 RepID=UPI0027E07A8E|nr:dTDP-glucose 4,6-dehydratase [Anaerocolumna sp. MB42-C2]WMJ88282.1 dTDP-glucose 4,6-dehydratase [Anaerocolumna sp. MB42-C2]
MKTYLVTGGAGFIGSNFILYLYQVYGNDIEVINLDLLTYAGNLFYLKAIENDPDYHFIQGDICNTKLVEDIMKTYDIDYVVHFAAESHVDKSIKDTDVFAKTNIMGTLNLLNCAKKSWEIDNGFKTGKKFLYISTDEVYGELGKEGYFTETSPISPRNPYSASKASGDMMTKAYSETYGFPAVRTRCSNNFGPHQFYEKLIPLYIKNCLLNKKLPVYGDGSAVRDWIYVSDHCSAIDLVLQSGKLGEVYNIGSHNEKTTLEIAKTVTEILKNEYTIKIPEDRIAFVKDRKGHDRRYAIDSSKIGRELGWKPCKTFDEGIRETIKWYLNHMDAIKD